MTDIVERLRRWREERSVAGGSWWETPEVCEQAADEIERLRGALREIETQNIVEISLDPDWPRRIARAALRNKETEE